MELDGAIGIPRLTHKKPLKETRRKSKRGTVWTRLGVIVWLFSMAENIFRRWLLTFQRFMDFACTCTRALACCTRQFHEVSVFFLRTLVSNVAVVPGTGAANQAESLLRDSPQFTHSHMTHTTHKKVGVEKEVDLAEPTRVFIDAPPLKKTDRRRQK